MSIPAGSEAGKKPLPGLLKRIAIFGPGLIGGSIALALRGRSPETAITIWGRNPVLLREISDRNLADSVSSDPAEAVRDADLIILCTPVNVMPELAAAIAPSVEPHAFITDAGSVKGPVVAKLTPIFGGHFVGAHPMAGSERSGLAAANDDLFLGAPCILTPLETTAAEALESISAFWVSLGAHITTMTPVAHDRLVARLSHLPRALAFALANLVADSLPEGSSLLAGGSYRDGTRVAASDPPLWTGILMENRSEVIAALHEISDLLGNVARNLEEGKSDSLLDFLTHAKEHRDRLSLALLDRNSTIPDLS